MTRLAALFALALVASGCASQSRPDAEALSQNLSVFAPSQVGATSMLLFTEADGDRVLMRLREVKREPEGGGWRLTLKQSFAMENGREETGEEDTYSMLFATKRLEFARLGEPNPMVAIAPLLLRPQAAPHPSLANLTAIAPLDLPYGRIPWAAAFQQAQGDRVATAWFAPGMGLVRFQEASQGKPGPDAQLKLMMVR